MHEPSANLLDIQVECSSIHLLLHAHTIWVHLMMLIVRQIFMCNWNLNLTHYYFSVEVTFSLYTYHIPSSVRFSAPKLHTSALAAILYTFVMQTTPTH